MTFVKIGAALLPFCFMMGTSSIALAQVMSTSSLPNTLESLTPTGQIAGQEPATTAPLTRHQPTPSSTQDEGQGGSASVDQTSQLTGDVAVGNGQFVQQGLTSPVQNADGQTLLPNFYQPPEASQPVQSPSVIVETSQQAQNQQGHNGGPPMPPGTTGATYSAALASTFPMSPQEIIAFRRQNDQINVAKSIPIGPLPKAASRSIMVSLSPGQKAPDIHLYPNNATSMTFADNTGAPWPIESVIIGDKASYTVDFDKSGSSNILVLSPLTTYSDMTNLIVQLKGNPAPLIFSLSTGDGKLDYRVDVNVEAAGPNAVPNATPTSTLPPADDTLMQQFVDDVPPPGAKTLTTSSAAIQGWSYKGDYFLRTSATLMGFMGNGQTDIANSVDGVHVYRMSPQATVTMSMGGQLSIVTIKNEPLFNMSLNSAGQSQ